MARVRRTAWRNAPTVSDRLPCGDENARSSLWRWSLSSSRHMNTLNNSRTRLFNFKKDDSHYNFSLGHPRKRPLRGLLSLISSLASPPLSTYTTGTFSSSGTVPSPCVR